MSKLKSLSAREIIAVFRHFSFRKISQRGSHVKLLRVFDNKEQTLVIPNHKSLKKGTIKEIFNQACRFISKEDLKSFFYTD
jgi:predicted RNA binding protein YcfA (HicA-like mRNA interferase family)